MLGKSKVTTGTASEILDLMREDSLMPEETNKENRHRAYAAIYIRSALSDLKDTAKFLEVAGEKNKQLVVKWIIRDLGEIRSELIERSGYITLKTPEHKKGDEE